MTSASILDTVPFPWSHAEAKEFQEKLMELYPSRNDATHVSELVGLSVSSLNVNQAPAQIWKDILDQCARAGLTRSLALLVHDSLGAQHPVRPFTGQLLSNRKGMFTPEEPARINTCPGPESPTPSGWSASADPAVRSTTPQGGERCLVGPALKHAAMPVPRSSSLSRQPEVMCGFFCVVLAIAAGLVWHWLGLPPAGAEKLMDVANGLPEAERKPFVENGIIKTYLRFPVDVPIDTMATRFYECDEAHKSNRGGEADLKGLSLKVQVLVPSLTVRTMITVRPRTAPSTAGTESWTRAFSYDSAMKSVTECVRDEALNVGYEEFSPQVEKGGAIVIVSFYRESYFAAATLEGKASEKRGWIYVEVTDFAGKTQPESYLGIGTDNTDSLSLHAYQVWPADIQPLLAKQRNGNLLSSTELLRAWPVACALAEQAVLEYLVSTKASEVGAPQNEGDFTRGVGNLLKHIKAGEKWNCVGHYIKSASRDMAFILIRGTR